MFLARGGIIMRKGFKLLYILLFVPIFIGCATFEVTQLKPIISQGKWSTKVSKNRLYHVCLVALQMESFRIDSLKNTNMGNKIYFISTKYKRFHLFDNEIDKRNKIARCCYVLQILIHETTSNEVLVDVTIKRFALTGIGRLFGYYGKDEMRRRANNKIVNDVENLFNRINILLGESGCYTRGVNL